MKLHGAVWRAAQGFEPAKLASLLCLGRLMREAVVSRFWGLVFVGCALPWCLFWDIPAGVREEVQSDFCRNALVLGPK